MIFSPLILGFESAWSQYVHSCECGRSYDNNCAHYISNALINGGFSDLDGGNGADMRKVNGRIVCCSGRPIRAKELCAWAEAKWGPPKSKVQDGIYFVYQERRSDSQGHVLLQKYAYLDDQHKQLKMSGVNGTGNYPNWEKQKYYC